MYSTHNRKKLGRWAIETRDARPNGTLHVALESPSGMFVDYPIQGYDNGDVAYDFPERIPASVRLRVPQYMRQFVMFRATGMWYTLTSARRVRLNAGGYEYGKYGQYYGTGQPLYRVWIDVDGEEYVFEVRANDRADAIDDAMSQARFKTYYV